MAEDNKEGLQLKIPVLSCILRKIGKNKKAIERTLKTKKETKGEIKKRTFLCGLFGISSGKKFNILKLRKN